jgi:para-nitrobenzyl esterase
VQTIAHNLTRMMAGVAAEVSNGVVSTLGVHYGARLDPADRFSPLGDPSPGKVQSAPSVFPQTPGSLDWLLGPALMEPPQSEDAFQINIWAPADAQDAPVLVYLPGGAFISGAGTVRWYDGERLAREGGCVVVTVNYRLGALAFAADGDRGQNLPVGDILQALRWIRSNIAQFGGSPEHVTLVGQSAGAFYAYLLSQLPEAEGLFNRTALLSLAWQPPLTPTEYADRCTLLVQSLGEAGFDVKAGLESVPVDALLKAQGAVSKAYAGRGLGFMPVADGTVPADLFDFEAAVRRMHVSSLLLNTTQDEAAAFLKSLPVAAVGREQLTGFVASHFEDVTATLARLDQALPGETDHAKLVEAMTLHQLRLAAVELAEKATAAGIVTTVARFDVASPLEGARSAHCFEVPFVFGNRHQWHDAPMLDGVADEVFETAGGELRSLLVGFVSEGSPRTAGGAAVAAFDPADPRLHRVGADGIGTMEPDRGLKPRR